MRKSKFLQNPASLPVDDDDLNRAINIQKSKDAPPIDDAEANQSAVAVDSDDMIATVDNPTKLATAHTQSLPRIVGIGASAGGLEALRLFVARLPSDSGLSFIVAQHLSPQHRSMMAELLSREATLEVRQATQNLRPKPNVMYIAPPNADVFLTGGKIILRKPHSSIGPKPSADFLLNSLAEELGDQAIGIILSGTGSDGSYGLRAIKAAGGITIAQEPNTAKYDSMPASAIRAGVVDLVLSPETMAVELPRLASSPQGLKTTISADSEQTEGPLQTLINLICRQTHIDFSSYRESTLRRQIERRLAANGLHRLEDYVAFAQRQPAEILALARHFLVSVTSFFRDPDSFKALRGILRQHLLAERQGHRLRIWIPGCATGEEAYSIAILVAEVMRESDLSLDVKIFATDIDLEATEVARRGWYPDAALVDLDQALIRAYFEQQGRHYKVCKSIREMINFARHDLVRDPPFPSVNLISCRNVLIYFKPELQERIMQRFHYSLVTNGILFLGKSENVGNLPLFVSIDLKSKIFRKGAVETPLRSAAAFNMALATVNPLATPPAARSNGPGEALKEMLLEVYAPPSILIDQDYTCLHFFGDAGRFLRHPSGRASLQLSAICLPELRAELQLIVHRALKEGQPAHSQALALRSRSDDQRQQIVRLTGRPVALPNGLDGILISFEALPELQLPLADADVKGEAGAHQRIQQLERELNANREHMQALVEELETANEELQSLNEELQASGEELQASNEELETANEELQATNEELTTLNEELQVKSGELAEANADLSNLQSSLELAWVVTDQVLRVTRFSPPANQIFQIEPDDLGQSITRLPSRIELPQLREKLQNVLTTGEIMTDSLCAENQYWMLRITPYRNGENQVTGAVLSFTDLSSTEQMLSKLEESQQRFQLASHNAPIGLALVGLDGRWLEVNPAICKITGYTEAELKTIDFQKLTHPDDLECDLGHVQRLIQGDIDGYRLEKRYLRKDGSVVPIELHVSMVRNRRNQPQYFISQIIDQSELAWARAQEHHLLSRLALAAGVAGLGIWEWDIAHRQLLWDERMYALYGVADREMTRKLWLSFVHPEDRKALGKTLSAACAGKIQRASGEFRAPSRDAQGVRWLAYDLRVENDAQGQPLRVVGVNRDVTAVKEYQQLLVDARDGAEATAHAKSRFLAIMSHEIRTPMNGVVGLIELLQYSALDQEQQQIVAALRQAAVSLKQLLDDILDFSRIEAGKLQLEMISFPLIETVERAAETFSSQAAAQGLNFTVRLASQLPETVVGDPNRLRQILCNLLSNAIKFTPSTAEQPGRVALEADVAAPPDQGVVRVRFQVRDNGIGIGKSAQRRLFQPFTQAEDSTTRRYGGTGLGLSICTQLSQLMGGTLQLDSALGRGSAFTVELPYVLDSAPAGEPALNGIRVLLVGPESGERQTAVDYLRAGGVEDIVSMAALEPALTRAPLDAPAPDLVLFIGLSLVSSEVFSGCAALRRRFNAPVLVLMPHDQRCRLEGRHAECVIVNTSPLLRSTLWQAAQALLDRRTPSNASLAESASAGDQPLPRILVAEDSAMNLEVLRRQFALLGYPIDVAETGVAALERLRQNPQRYALLLTDINMPEMDGCQLAAQIRSDESGGGPRLPIIALSANAFEDEQQCALAQGIDDYLVKPVSLEALKSAIEHWLGQQPLPLSVGAAQPAERAAPSTASAAGYDRATLKHYLGTDDADCNQFLAQFIDSALQTLSTLESAKRQNQFSIVQRCAHSVKSLAKTLGASQVMESCAAVEAAARQEQPERLWQLIPVLDKQVADLCAAIRADLA